MSTENAATALAHQGRRTPRQDAMSAHAPMRSQPPEAIWQAVAP